MGVCCVLGVVLGELAVGVFGSCQGQVGGCGCGGGDSACVGGLDGVGCVFGVVCGEWFSVGVAGAGATGVRWVVFVWGYSTGGLAT